MVGTALTRLYPLYGSCPSGLLAPESPEYFG